MSRKRSGTVANVTTMAEIGIELEGDDANPAIVDNGLQRVMRSQGCAFLLTWYRLK